MASANARIQMAKMNFTTRESFDIVWDLQEKRVDIVKYPLAGVEQGHQRDDIKKYSRKCKTQIENRTTSLLLLLRPIS